MAKSKFKIGDSVYSPHFGEGVVNFIDEEPLLLYPIHVKWTKKKQPFQRDNDIFTPEGNFNVGVISQWDIVPLGEEQKTPEFKLMDRVFFPFYGDGTVVGVRSSDEPYPIRVFWDKSPYKNEPWSMFTRDGVKSLHVIVGDEKFKLMLLKDIPKEETGGSEVGRFVSAIKHIISQKEKGKTHDEDRKFKVGDRVYLPYHYGTITAIYDDNRTFPIEVTWDEMIRGEKFITTYTADGYSMTGAQDGVPYLTVVHGTSTKEGTVFKAGDVVWSKRFGCGRVTSTDIGTGTPYVVEVTWEGEVPHYDYFTKDGQYDLDDPDPDCNIYPITEEEQKAGSTTSDAWLNHVKNYVLMQLEKHMANSKEKEAEEMKESIGFKLGDRVYAPYHGYGTVTAILSNTVYPIEVTWDIGWGLGAYTSTFTLDGHLSRFIDKDDTTISVVKEGKEAVMTGLTKVDYSPINPSHYQVAGIPEAIDIMKHLMTQEQFEGFLWGNIIKYAYRYGRKGDEAETAGKIEWYANRLKEVCAEKRKE